MDSPASLERCSNAAATVLDDPQAAARYLVSVKLAAVLVRLVESVLEQRPDEASLFSFCRDFFQREEDAPSASKKEPSHRGDEDPPAPGTPHTVGTDDPPQSPHGGSAAASPTAGFRRPQRRHLRRLFPAVRNNDFVFDDAVPARVGHYGRVRKAYWKQVKNTVAVKIVPIEATWTLDEWTHLEACQRRHSPRESDPQVAPLTSWGIVRCYGCFYDATRDRLWFVMEWIDNTIESRCGKMGSGIDAENAARRIIRPLLAALAHVHRCNRVHLDVKPANILLDGDRVVLADFGTAQELGKPLVQLGDFKFMSPEVFFEAVPADDSDGDSANVYVASCDSWSVGSTLVQLLEGYPPLEGPTETYFQVLRDCWMVPTTQHPLRCSCELLHFLACCFERDPRRRLTAAQLLDHVWLQ